MIRPFLVALQFLTCIPVFFRTIPDEKTVGYSLLYYPIVGLIIGIALSGFGWALQDAPALIAAALLITGWIVLTGGLHLDGLADSADAWKGGMGNIEKSLSIMKDPRCGTAGVIAIVLVILLKWLAVHSLFLVQDWVSLICTVVLARTLIPLLFLTTPYVRCNGLGTLLVQNQPRKLSGLSVLITFLAIAWIAGFSYLWLSIVALLIFLCLRQMMVKRIHGTTGDTAGALIEITETTVLITGVLLLN